MRAQRLLSILMHLQVNRRMTARDLARKLEVSERTILRDMDALSSSGVPVVAGRGAGGGWSLLAEYETRLTGLSPEEIQSLIVSRAPKLAAAARRQADLMRQRVLIDPPRMAQSRGNGIESPRIAGCLVAGPAGSLRL
jgi:predicted DNA-binding transcriptional regulator YafY